MLFLELCISLTNHWYCCGKLLLGSLKSSYKLYVNWCEQCPLIADKWGKWKILSCLSQWIYQNQQLSSRDLVVYLEEWFSCTSEEIKHWNWDFTWSLQTVKTPMGGQIWNLSFILCIHIYKTRGRVTGFCGIKSFRGILCTHCFHLRMSVFQEICKQITWLFC